MEREQISASAVSHLIPSGRQAAGEFAQERGRRARGVCQPVPYLRATQPAALICQSERTCGCVRLTQLKCKLSPLWRGIIIFVNRYTVCVRLA